MGVGPTSQAWEARILPMYYARKSLASTSNCHFHSVEREHNLDHAHGAKFLKIFQVNNKIFAVSHFCFKVFDNSQIITTKQLHFTTIILECLVV